MWHKTDDMWHLIGDTRQVTRDTWYGVNILSKFQLSSSSGLGVKMFWRFGGKALVNESVTEVFVEQPRSVSPIF